MDIPQIETNPAWQCPYCGDWFTDGENRCGDCSYTPMTDAVYSEVLKRGCGHYKTWTDCGYDYDCEHKYDWICEDCPIVIEHHRATNRQEKD